VALAQGLIDGYAGNNPYPAIGREKGLLKIIAPLDDLPGSVFESHPCCCVAARTDAIENKEEAVMVLLTLMLEAVKTINTDLDAAVASGARWVGTSESVERESVPTSTYTMARSSEWHAAMREWLRIMNRLGLFRGKLEGLSEGDVAARAYDFTVLQIAEKRAAETGTH